MVCKHCGQENKSNAKFCTNCGEQTDFKEHYITCYQPADDKKVKKNTKYTISPFKRRLALQFEIIYCILNAADSIDKTAINSRVAVENRADIVNENVGSVHKLTKIVFLHI